MKLPDFETRVARFLPSRELVKDVARSLRREGRLPDPQWTGADELSSASLAALLLGVLGAWAFQSEGDEVLRITGDSAHHALDRALLGGRDGGGKVERVMVQASPAKIEIALVEYGYAGAVRRETLTFGPQADSAGLRCAVTADGLFLREFTAAAQGRTIFELHDCAVVA